MKIAILGYGVVGSGVYEVIRKNPAAMRKKAGQEIDVKYILDIRDFPDHPEPHLFTKDFDKILADDEVSLVVEVMGGCEPAYTYTKKALLAGKHAVSSNKELVATHGAELLAIAKEKNTNYMFEASVGGGIPIIRPLNQCLAANEITEIMGILNGTTNYILTQMIKCGQSFADALADAQDKGYAERNPAADVDGIDAQRKIAILTSLVYGKEICPKDIPTCGITGIDLEDVAYAEALGAAIKLIGHSYLKNGMAYAEVCPMLIPSDHPLYGVEDVFNSILVKGDSIGDVMFYGRGAGKLPTASAVVADVIDIARNGNNHRLFWKGGDEARLIDGQDVEVRMLVRVAGSDEAKAAEAFGDVDVVHAKGVGGEFGFVTPPMARRDFERKIAGLSGVLKTIQMAIEEA